MLLHAYLAKLRLILDHNAIGSFNIVKTPTLWQVFQVATSENLWTRCTYNTSKQHRA